jgi:hypothetical protein
MMEAVAATAEKEEKKLFFQFNKMSAIVMVDGMNLTWFRGCKLEIIGCDGCFCVCCCAVLQDFDAQIPQNQK